MRLDSYCESDNLVAPPPRASAAVIAERGGQILVQRDPAGGLDFAQRDPESSDFGQRDPGRSLGYA